MSNHPCQGKSESKLSHARVLELLAYNPDTGYFSQRISRGGCRPGKPLGHVEKIGYRRLCIDGKRILAHRLAWFYVYGKWPRQELDHIDLCKDNNGIKNLREATPSQNQANNGARPSKSGLKGAHWNQFRNYWQSYIKIDGKSVFLGRFDTAQAAHAAYADAALIGHKEFVRVEK